MNVSLNFENLNRIRTNAEAAFREIEQDRQSSSVQTLETLQKYDTFYLWVSIDYFRSEPIDGLKNAESSSMHEIELAKIQYVMHEVDLIAKSYDGLPELPRYAEKFITKNRELWSQVLQLRIRNVIDLRKCLRNPSMPFCDSYYNSVMSSVIIVGALKLDGWRKSQFQEQVATIRDALEKADISTGFDHFSIIYVISYCYCPYLPLPPPL